MFLYLVLGIPLAGTVLLILVGHRRSAPAVNILCSGLTVLAASALTLQVMRDGPRTELDEQFFVDAFNVFLVALTAFVSFTTALFSRPYMRVEEHHGRVSARRLRLYHSMYQLFIFTMLLALLTNNMGILWVAMEGATLATVLLVSLYRTPESIEAAWKYFILCGVGIAQALFGTILLYFAAEKVLGAGAGALLWTHLNEVRTSLEPQVLSLAFIFMLIGYGTKVGLAPVHNWLPDAHSEGPTPVSAVLSGLLLNVALYALVRGKVLVDGALGTGFGSKLLMGFGLVSVVIAVFSLARQTDIKRMFAYSSIEHMGLTTFAFGLGGPIGTFAALLHMTVHSLTKSAIFFAVGHASQIAGSPAHGPHPRPHPSEPDRGLGPDARDPRHPGPPALRGLHERVPDHHHHDARATVGHAGAPRLARGRLRRGLRQGTADGVREHGRAGPATLAGALAGVHPHGAGSAPGPLHPPLPGTVVPARGTVHRVAARRPACSRRSGLCPSGCCKQ